MTVLDYTEFCLPLLQAIREEMFGLLGEDRLRRTGNESVGLCVPLEVFRLRGVRCPPAEGRPVCYKTGSAVLQARLREGSRDATGILTRYILSTTINTSLIIVVNSSLVCNNGKETINVKQ